MKLDQHNNSFFFLLFGRREALLFSLYTIFVMQPVGNSFFSPSLAECHQLKLCLDIKEYKQIRHNSRVNRILVM